MLSSVNIELDGQRIKSITNSRPRVTIEVNEITVEGRVRGYHITLHELGVKEPVGRLSMDGYNDTFVGIPGDRIHLFDLKVPKQFRNMGFGTILINCYKQYALEADYTFTSLRVGNGSTKDFLIKSGFNEEFLHTHQFPGASNSSVVMTQKHDMDNIRGTVAVAETAEQIVGVFVEDAFQETR